MDIVDDKAPNIPALDKAFAVLDYITDSPKPLTAAQIAKDLGLPRSSTYRLLMALVQKGVLRKDENNVFYLGAYLLYWAGKFEQQENVIALFHELILTEPVLMPHTVTLSSLDGERGEMVFLACHESPSPLGFTFRAGVRVPAVFAATGKAVLATLDFNEVRTMYADGLPPPLTQYGVAGFEQLRAEFESVQTTRMSLDDGQLREGMYCIGTYIRNSSGRANVGVAVSFLKNEYQQKQAEVGAALISLAEKIERRLGFLGYS
ncbi:IclR family transcriptional regulator [Neisseria lisongii]|uniref:IclR family transcriptional regulator n=1 Tax=Neisseria lisongii TaxID=2912188 RepID=A0AAW5AR08_9NEIS|nr:IclR family transcriptional regulator [Neisseria lisongii]MCF7530343.1 IclR family transcriptional regulator [Neisseria lisongii]